MSLIRTVLFKCFNTFTGGGPASGADVPSAAESCSASSFQMADDAPEALYKRLVAVANGDPRQVLPAMDSITRVRNIDEAALLERIREVGVVRPYEAGHLMTRLFTRATTETRLAILKEFVTSPTLGDKHAVGDLFVSLMERSTREERRSEIYPGLYRLIDAAKGPDQEVQGKRAFLIALLKGWMSEI